MTLHAIRVNYTPNIRVSMTSGSIVASLEEPYQYLRFFHKQLGELPAKVENDCRERAYE